MTAATTAPATFWQAVFGPIDRLDLAEARAVLLEVARATDNPWDILYGAPVADYAAATAAVLGLDYRPGIPAGSPIPGDGYTPGIPPRM